jgi:hypothetical protein
MIKITCILMVTATLSVVGCKSGAAKHVAQGAVRGATHGVIDDKAKSHTGRGAAHGALGSAYQVRDANKAERNK